MCTDSLVTSSLPFCLPDGYNRFVRPYKGQAILNISLTVWITDIVAVDDTTNTVTVDFFADVYWAEPRLNLSSNESLWSLNKNAQETAVGLDLIRHLWLPDLEISNVKDYQKISIIGKLGSFEIDKNNNVCYSFPGRVELECPFIFESYPLDSQVPFQTLFI